MLTIIGYVLLGILKLIAFFAAFLVVVAALAWGTEYFLTPLGKKTPRWVLTVWYYVWRGAIIVAGGTIFLAAMYAIGSGK